MNGINGTFDVGLGFRGFEIEDSWVGDGLVRVSWEVERRFCIGEIGMKELFRRG
jgi:hypothetical protein